jgi:hypothetical protein
MKQSKIYVVDEISMMSVVDLYKYVFRYSNKIDKELSYEVTVADAMLNYMCTDYSNDYSNLYYRYCTESKKLSIPDLSEIDSDSDEDDTM